MTEPLNASSSIVPGPRSDPTTSAKRFLLASVLVVSALIMGAIGGHRSFAALHNNWIAQAPERIAIAASALIPAFMTCGLLVIAARLLYSPTQKTMTGSRYSKTAILVALYGPFYWAITSSWWLTFPVLPGFTAGLFTKPLDNQLAFMAASCICTVLIVVSLCTLHDRLRYGRFAAPVLALVMSSLTSMAAYAFMRA